MWPGPTFEVRRGQRVQVRWINELPTKHFLPIDRTIHGADALAPDVRTVVHVHGARTWPDSDGYPEAWSTSDGHAGRYFSPEPSRYPNDQPAATLWYHDHAIGITRLNIYAGLSGFYLLRDEVERSMNLPADEYEIPLLVQDRTLDENGQLLYAPTFDDGLPLAPGVWGSEFF